MTTSKSAATLRPTLSDFVALLARDDWQRHTWIEDIEHNERVEPCIDDKGEYAERTIPLTYGRIILESELGGVTITYCAGFGYDDHMPDTLAITPIDEPYAISGAEYIDADDDDPEIISDAELIELFGDELSLHGFDKPDTTLLKIQSITDIDYDEDSDVDTITLDIDNAPSIRFTGELVASAASSDNQAMGSSYSGQTGRWTELALYKTKGGKFICHQVGRTRWQGERDRYSGKVCESISEVFEFFGHRWLAKELYEEAGIEDVTIVD